MKRRTWQHRAASSPAQPVALDGSSARGLLALLAGRDDEASVSAREALTAALAGGRMGAIREAMDAARAALPTPPKTWAERRGAELAEAVAGVEAAELDRLARSLGSRPVSLGDGAEAEPFEGDDDAGAPGAPRRPAYERPPEPDPRAVLAAYDEALLGELSQSQRWNLEHHRRDLARVMGNGAKSLPDFARKAARALEEHHADAERRRAADEKRKRAPRPSTPPPPEAA